MRYEMGVFLRQEWKDERLDFRPVLFKTGRAGRPVTHSLRSWDEIDGKDS